MRHTTSTLSPDDFFRMRFIQTAALSPDGQKVVYALSHLEDGAEKEQTALWLLDLSSNSARQLTTGQVKDFNPRWSPDNKHIAFISTRAGKPQIYTIPVDGGEAKALTTLSQGVTGALEWSPDGKQIAFTAGKAVEPRDHTRPYRLTRHVYRFDLLGYIEDVLQDIYVITLEDGQTRQLTDDNCLNTAPQWSPDGTKILHQSIMSPDSHTALFPRLKILTLDGASTELYDGKALRVVSAVWSPRGDSVIFNASRIDQPIGSKNSLWIINAQGGEPECRSAQFPYEVGGRLQGDMPSAAFSSPPTIVASKDQSAAFIQVQIGGTVHIYRIALSGAESCEAIVTGDRACILAGSNGDKLLYYAASMNDPVDLYLADMDGTNEQRLTHINDDLLSQRSLPTYEHLLFPGSDGIQVEGWILKPATGQAPYPTVMYIHGGPHAAFGCQFHSDMQMLAGAGYAVLLVNHRASTGYGEPFGTAIKGDWGNLDYHDLMAGVDESIKRGIADPDRLGVCGLSGGGNLSCWIIGHTDRFKAAVPENPVTNWVSFYGTSDIGPWFALEELGGLPHEIPDVYARCSPITYAHRCTTPTLLVLGENDWRCPAEQGEQFYGVLKANGCPTEMVRLPKSSHAGAINGDAIIRRAQNDALLDWMNRYIMGH